MDPLMDGTMTDTGPQTVRQHSLRYCSRRVYGFGIMDSDTAVRCERVGWSGRVPTVGVYCTPMSS